METDVVIQEKSIPFLDLDNFDESAMSPVVYSAVKIKEEPKEDDDVEEDDGFEDVGTVVMSAIEEITIESDSIGKLFAFCFCYVKEKFTTNSRRFQHYHRSYDIIVSSKRTSNNSNRHNVNYRWKYDRIAEHLVGE